MSAGKGDKQRPRQISKAEWDRRWRQTFNNAAGSDREHRTRAPETTANRRVANPLGGTDLQRRGA